MSAGEVLVWDDDCLTCGESYEFATDDPFRDAALVARCPKGCCGDFPCRGHAPKSCQKGARA